MEKEPGDRREEETKEREEHDSQPVYVCIMDLDLQLVLDVALALEGPTKRWTRNLELILALLGLCDGEQRVLLAARQLDVDATHRSVPALGAGYQLASSTTSQKTCAIAPALYTHPFRYAILV